MTHENDDKMRVILDLFQQYQDGVLTPDESAAFIEELKNDPEKRQVIYDTQLQIQSMRDLAQIADVQRQALHLNQQKESHGDCITCGDSQVFNRLAWPYWIAAAAAVLVISFLFARFGSPLKPTVESVALARVKYVRQTIWDQEKIDYQPGQMLAAGNYGLLAGTVCLEIPQKAVLTIAGPADFKLLDESTIHFHSGKLSARIIGENAITIQSPTMDVIDRGTAFGLEVLPDQQTLVSVFQGAVEVVPHRREVNPENLLIRKGASVSGDWQEGVVEHVSYDPSAFEELWPLTHGIGEMSDTTIFLPPGPLPPLETFQNDSKLFLLPEKQNVIVKEWIPVDLLLPDRQIDPKDKKSFLTSPNRHRNSFLFFLNRSNSDIQKSKKIRGVIIFTDEIKGIFYTPDKLARTDVIFGVDEITYDRADWCGLEVAETIKDRIEGIRKRPRRDYIRIAPSRRKLYFELDGQSGPDQFRVIVDAD